MLLALNLAKIRNNPIQKLFMPLNQCALHENLAQDLLLDVGFDVSVQSLSASATNQPVISTRAVPQKLVNGQVGKLRKLRLVVEVLLGFVVVG